MERIVTSGTVEAFVSSLAEVPPRVDEWTGVRVTVDLITESNRAGREVAAAVYTALLPGAESGAQLVARVTSLVEPWVEVTDESEPSLNGHSEQLVATALYALLDDVLEPLDRIVVRDPSPALRAAIERNDDVRLIGPTSAQPMIVIR